MFPTSMSTPFSVKDILNLEQSHDVMVSSLDASSRMDCCTGPTSSCMLARLKQEPLRDMSLFGEDFHEPKSGRTSSLNFASSFYGKSLIEMEIVKDGKSESYEGKRRKGELIRRQNEARRAWCWLIRAKCIWRNNRKQQAAAIYSQHLLQTG